MEPVTQKFKLSQDFCTMHLPIKFIILCLIIQKFCVDRQICWQRITSNSQHNTGKHLPPSPAANKLPVLPDIGITVETINLHLLTQPIMAQAHSASRALSLTICAMLTDDSISKYNLYSAKVKKKSVCVNNIIQYATNPVYHTKFS